MPTKSARPTDLPRATDVKSPTAHSMAVTGAPPGMADSCASAAWTALRSGVEREFMGDSLRGDWPIVKGHLSSHRLGHLASRA